jgi:hypothetical protein
MFIYQNIYEPTAELNRNLPYLFKKHRKKHHQVSTVFPSAL